MERLKNACVALVIFYGIIQVAGWSLTFYEKQQAPKSRPVAEKPLVPATQPKARASKIIMGSPTGGEDRILWERD